MEEVQVQASLFSWALRRNALEHRVQGIQSGLDKIADSSMPDEARKIIGSCILDALLNLNANDNASKQWEEELFKALRRTMLLEASFSYSELHLETLVDAMDNSNVGDNVRNVAIRVALELLDVDHTVDTDASEFTTKCLKLIGIQLQKITMCSKIQRNTSLLVMKALVVKHGLMKTLQKEWLSDYGTSALGTGCFISLCLVVGRCIWLHAEDILVSLAAEYARVVVGHKSPAKIPVGVLRCLEPTVRRFRLDHFQGSGSDDDNSIQASMLRLLKKAPEGASSLAKELCAQLYLHTDSFCENGAVAGCLRMMKSDSFSTRANGRAALGSLIMKLSGYKAIDKVYLECLNIVVIRASSTPAQRMEVATLFNSIVYLCLKRKDCGAELLVTTGPVLLAQVLGTTGAMAKETDDITKNLIAKFAGPWISGLDPSACTTLAATIIPALQGKQALSHLIVLSAAANKPSSGLSAIVAPLLPYFETLFKKASAVNRNECVLALYVLQQASSTTIETDAAVANRTLYHAEWLVKLFAQPTSFITAVGTFSSEPSAVECSVASARCAIIGGAIDVPGAVSALVSLSLHPVADVRQMAFSAFGCLQRAIEGATADLAKELRQCVVNGNSQSVIINRVASSGASVANQIPANMSFGAKADAATELLLLAGRLAVVCKESPGMASRLALSTIKALGALDPEVEELCGQKLCAAAAQSSAYPELASAAVKGLGALGSSDAWQGTLECAAHSLLTALSEPAVAIAAVDPEEARLILDPEGAIRDATQAAAASVKGEVKVTNADRKKAAPRKERRGLFGADAGDDMDFAEKVKAEKNAAQIEAANNAEKEALESIRDKIATQGKAVSDLQNQVCGLLSAYSALIQGSLAVSDIACEIAADLVPVLVPLLAAPLVANEAMELAKLLASASLEHPLSRVFDDCCYALLAVAETNKSVMYQGKRPPKNDVYLQERLLKLMDRAGPFVRVLRVAASASARASVSSAAFAFLFPVLECLLDLPSAIPECTNAFTILSDCIPKGANPDLGSRHCAVLELCLRAVHRPRMEPKPEDVLKRLCGTQLTDSTPLIGQYGLLCEHDEVRGATLRIIQSWLSAIGNKVPLIMPVAEVARPLSLQLLVAQCDENATNAATGANVWRLWEDLAGAGGGVPVGAWIGSILEMTSEGTCAKRERCSRAFAVGAKLHSVDAENVMKTIMKLYEDYPPPASTQQGGRTQQRIDDTQPFRRAAADGLRALGASCALVNSNAALSALKFACTVGAIDKDASVRELFVSAGVAILDSYAQDTPQLLQFLQTEMRPAKPGEDLDAFDNRREAVVVLLGAAGKYAPADATAIVEGIVASLVEALKTPSEAVQTAVAACLIPLVQRSKTAESTKELLTKLLDDVLGAETYGERRGAAFGLASFIKGMGIAVLKQHDVVAHLRENCEKGSVQARQGALGAFERLSAQLGLLFEPYVVTIIPVLLKSFSHSHDLVRDAAKSTAMVIMGRLSAHGVKQVIAPILSSLPTEPAWKTRLESLRLLGTMAHCAPKQLAVCLPQIVPCLVDAGNDTHPRVKEGARLAMEDITTVIRNPEIANMSPTLLSAMAHPATHTKAALEALLNCEFMHAIDAPSLALLVPILGRALKDRTADLKRRSAAITGNMVTMVGDSKFLLPYLEHILPGLKECLLDPIPDVRATSAKALGSLVGGVGETDELLEIIPWLTLTLTNESSPVERSGAAQGLAELCFALGDDRLANVLDQALPMQNSQSYAAREGLLWLLSYLPSALHGRYAPHVQTTLPVVLGGLSDSVESVREVAMRAGQVTVSTLGRSNTTMLLPSLRAGVLDDDWRIRHASVQLLGELLYLVGDAKPADKMNAAADVDDDEEEEESAGGSTTKVFANIRAHLGSSITENILATLYIVRHDVAGACRQSSVQVWKSIVTNTPRIVMEIAGEMVLQLVQLLASESEDLRVMAGRALGDVTSKLGDRILPTIMPHMSAGLRSEDQAMRQGVCLGLAEILSAISKRQIENYVDVLVPALQQGFCDSSESVRNQASRAFQTLFKMMGANAIEAIVPPLMRKVNENPSNDEEAIQSAAAILGLQGLVATRPRDMIEYIVPTALKTPMTSHGCYVLGGMAEAGGPCMQYHCTTLVTCFVQELIRLDAAVNEGDRDAAELLVSVKACAQACLSAMTTDGVNSLLQELAKQVDHETSIVNRRWGCYLLQCFVGGSSANFRDYLPLILKGLLTRIAETYKPLLEEVRDALSALVKSVPAEPLLNQLDFIRSCIASTASDAKFRSGGNALLNEQGELELPIFSLPKALEPFMSIYNHGLVNGSPEKREACANAMGELFLMTSPAAMKPYLIKTTGPLIRVVGDRFPSSVKSAILSTLAVLLRKGGVALKAFAPQLQTTFVKALNDPSRQTRQHAAIGLGLLTGVSPRTDGLLAELGNALGIAESSAIRTSIYEAITQSLEKAGTPPSAVAVEKAKLAIIGSLLSEDEEAPRVAGCCAIGSLATCMDDEAVVNVLTELTSQVRSSNVVVAIAALGAGACAASFAAPNGQASRSALFTVVTSGLNDSRAQMKQAACNAAATIWGPRRKMAPDASLNSEALKAFAGQVALIAEDKNSDDEVKKQAVKALKAAAKAVNFTKNSKEFGVAPLPAAAINRFTNTFVMISKELDSQLAYQGTRGLHYLFNWPKGSSAMTETLKGISDANITNILKEFQRKKVYPTDDADSDEDIQ
jgi:hypothetical protein